MPRRANEPITPRRLRNYANRQMLNLILTLGTFKQAMVRCYNELPQTAKQLYRPEIQNKIEQLMLALMSIQHALEIAEEDIQRL